MVTELQFKIILKTAGILAGAYAGYRFLKGDSPKQAVKKTISLPKDAINEVTKVINPVVKKATDTVKVGTTASKQAEKAVNESFGSRMKTAKAKAKAEGRSTAKMSKKEYSKIKEKVWKW